MSIRTKSRRRILLLVALLSLVVGGGAWWYWHRESMRDEEARASRAAGLLAFREGRFEDAATELGLFLRRLEPDGEALLKYAQAVRRIDAPDARHIDSAIGSLRQLLALEPGNLQARRELLDLYLEIGVRTEALGLANSILDISPRDEQAVHAKAFTLTVLGRYEEALATLKEVIGPESDRLPDQLLYLDVLAALERPRDVLLERADLVLEAHASDPRFQLVKVRVQLLLAEDPEGARDLLEGLLPLAEADEKFARLLLRDLDAAGMTERSLAILEAMPAASLDADLRTQLATRMWEAGRIRELPAHVERWGIPLDRLGSRTLGYLVLAWDAVEDAVRAGEALAVLDTRVEDAAAKAWRVLIRGTVLPEAVGVRQRIDACRDASAADRANAVARFELGRAWEDAAERELALAAYMEAARLAPNWPEPLRAALSVLMASGRFGEAIELARVSETLYGATPRSRLLLTLGDLSGRGGGLERALRVSCYGGSRRRGCRRNPRFLFGSRFTSVRAGSRTRDASWHRRWTTSSTWRAMPFSATQL